MIPDQETVLVLGAGSWGGVLAHLLAGKGVPVRLWSHTPDHAQRLAADRTLPGKIGDFRLHPAVQVGSDLDAIRDGATAILFAVPSRHIRETAERLVGPGPLAAGSVVVTASKGYEAGSLKPQSEIFQEVLGASHPVILSGPSHAEEVAGGLPTTVVAASTDHSTAERVQALFMTPRFRVYTSEDITGVQLGGALKNVIAIAAGAASGMGFGDNTLAALVTRGLAEMSRLGVAMGADPLTFMGLSGLGDLVVTCVSRHSRNRRLGSLLAEGISLESALERIGMAVEGVEMARSVKQLSALYGVEMPISTQVAETLFEGTPAKEAVAALMLRDPKPEHHPRED